MKAETSSQLWLKDTTTTATTTQELWEQLEQYHKYDGNDDVKMLFVGVEKVTVKRGQATDVCRGHSCGNGFGSGRGTNTGSGNGNGIWPF